MTQSHIIRTYDTTGYYWYEKIWRSTCCFSCFVPDVGWLLATDFSKGWKTSEFAQKVATFALSLPGSCVQSSKQRSAEKHDCFTKVSSNPLLPMICPIKSHQFSDSKIDGFSFVFWLSTIARSAKQQDRELKPPPWEDGEDDQTPAQEEEAKPARIWSAVRGAIIGCNGGFKFPNENQRIYEWSWNEKSLGEWVKRQTLGPWSLTCIGCSRFCLWSSRVQVEGLASCGAPCLLSQR